MQPRAGRPEKIGSIKESDPPPPSSSLRGTPPEVVHRLHEKFCSGKKFSPPERKICLAFKSLPQERKFYLCEEVLPRGRKFCND